MASGDPVEILPESRAQVRGAAPPRCSFVKHTGAGAVGFKSSSAGEQRHHESWPEQRHLRARQRAGRRGGGRRPLPADPRVRREPPPSSSHSRRWGTTPRFSLALPAIGSRPRSPGIQAGDDGADTSFLPTRIPKFFGTSAATPQRGSRSGRPGGSHPHPGSGSGARNSALDTGFDNDTGSGLIPGIRTAPRPREGADDHEPPQQSLPWPDSP